MLASGVAIQVIGSAALLGLGGALVLRGELTLGQLVAAEIVFTTIASALNKMHKQFEAVFDVVVSAKKFAGLVDLPLDRRGGERLPGAGPIALQLTDVSVGHDGQPLLLQGVSLALRAGEHVAVCGAPGAGKSTLLEALGSTHPITGGTLAYDDHEIGQLSLLELRGAIYPLRDSELACDTIEGNLRLVRPDVDSAELEAVLAATSLVEPIAALPLGRGTPLARTGRPLSRTATRRLAVARALLARPRLLLVDRGLDDLGLSGDAKAQLLDAVFEDRRTTMVVVSDDPDVIERCDRQLRIHDRRLEEVTP
jgi:putative ABC transport system ATP-binding protein